MRRERVRRPHARDVGEPGEARAHVLGVRQKQTRVARRRARRGGGAQAGAPRGARLSQERERAP